MGLKKLLNKFSPVSEGYPSLEFLRVRETLVKKNIETLGASRRALDEELIRLNAELDTIRKIKELHEMDKQKDLQMEEERTKVLE